MATVCQQCGDRGFFEALISCDKCQTTVVHRYCLNVLPVFDDDVIWSCEDCEPKVAKPSTLDNLNSLLNGKCDTGDLEIVPANGSVKQLKKKKQKRRGARCSLAKAEVRESKNSSGCHLGVHHSENHEKDQIFRRPKELDGSIFYEEVEPVKPKTSLIAGGDCKSNPESSCELHCSNSDKNIEKLGRQIVVDGSTSYEEAEPVKIRTSQVVTNGLPITIQCNSNAHKEPNLKVHFRGNKKKKFRKRRKLTRQIYDAEIESVKISALSTINNARISKYGSNVRAMSISEVQCNENDERDQRLIGWMGSHGASSNEESESVRTETSLVAARKPSNIPRQRFSIPAQPIIEPIWRGNLCLRTCNYGTIQGLVAHLSTLACPKVFQEAKLLPGLLCPELLPRSYAWPKSFHRWGPNDNDIALYLFPNNERAEKIYDWLVNDMIRHDLVMRTIVKNAELLLFPSILLPSQFWRFQWKFYLWGVFRGKQASSQSQALDLYSLNPILFVEPRDPMYALTWHATSPISPLSNRW